MTSSKVHNTSISELLHSIQPPFVNGSLIIFLKPHRILDCRKSPLVHNTSVNITYCYVTYWKGLCIVMKQPLVLHRFIFDHITQPTHVP